MEGWDLVSPAVMYFKTHVKEKLSSSAAFAPPPMPRRLVAVTIDIVEWARSTQDAEDERKLAQEKVLCLSKVCVRHTSISGFASVKVDWDSELANILER